MKTLNSLIWLDVYQKQKIYFLRQPSPRHAHLMYLYYKQWVPSKILPNPEHNPKWGNSSTSGKNLWNTVRTQKDFGAFTCTKSGIMKEGTLEVGQKSCCSGINYTQWAVKRCSFVIQKVTLPAVLSGSGSCTSYSTEESYRSLTSSEAFVL